MSDINDATGTPHTLSLGDVLADIELAPAQISELLRGLAYQHLGGPHDDMARTLLQHANDVANPATYGNAEQSTPDNPQARWGQVGGSTVTVPGASGAVGGGAAQGQSALPSAGTPNEPAWMADARAAGWQVPTRQDAPSAPNEPAWMADARRAGWQGQGQQQTPQDEQGSRAPATFSVTNPTSTPEYSQSTPPQPNAPRQ